MPRGSKRILSSTTPKVSMSTSLSHSHSLTIVVAYGLLFGEHSGRQVEIFNCAEIVVKDSVIDMQYLNTKREQCMVWFVSTVCYIASPIHLLLIERGLIFLTKCIPLTHWHTHPIMLLVKQVYKTLDLIGWYTIGTEVTPAHHAIHAQVGLNRMISLWIIECAMQSQYDHTIPYPRSWSCTTRRCFSL